MAGLKQIWLETHMRTHTHLHTQMLATKWSLRADEAKTIGTVAVTLATWNYKKQKLLTERGDSFLPEINFIIILPYNIKNNK